MKTMLSDLELSDAEVADLAEAAQAFHEARARADREYGADSVTLGAWQRWNEQHRGAQTEHYEHYEIRPEWLRPLSSPKRSRIDLPTILPGLFFLVVVVTVWVSVILDLRHFSGGR